jgi:hypothetical protein
MYSFIPDYQFVRSRVEERLKLAEHARLANQVRAGKRHGLPRTDSVVSLSLRRPGLSSRRVRPAAVPDGALQGHVDRKEHPHVTELKPVKDDARSLRSVS